MDTCGTRIVNGIEANTNLKELISGTKYIACDKYDWQYSPFFTRNFYENF